MASNIDPGTPLTLDSLFGVSGKVALVTGGGTGIGRMIATGLAQNGARVYIASRKLATVQKTADEINASGVSGQVIPLVADLVKGRAECERLAAEIAKREKVLHILVNNAGVSWGGPMEDYEEKRGWDDLLALNVKAIWYLSVALLPLLSASSGGNIFTPGRIINISSVGSVKVPGGESPLSRPGSGPWAYGPSKAAVNHLSRSMAVAFSKKTVTCNVIAPGFFVSRMTAYGYEHNRDVFLGNQPTGRVGTATDMAGLALFLCSRASAHITGTVIAIDGGAALTGGTKLPMNFKEKIEENQRKLAEERARL